jgi:hypothetical protein
MDKYTHPPGTAWHVVTERPVVFRGVPPLCAGEVELVNETDEKVKVRTLDTRPAKAGAIQLGVVRVGARLAPRSTVRAPAVIEVAESTPPGRYEIQAEGFGERPVIVQVFEKEDVALDPSQIRVRGAPGDVVTVSVAAANHGNVTVSIPEAALVHLEEDAWLGRALVFALRDASPDEGAQKYLDRVFKEMRETDVRPMRVDVTGGGKYELAPGDSADLDLTMTLPDELIKGRTYVRAIDFMTASLFFEVICDGSTVSTKRRAR